MKPTQWRPWLPVAASHESMISTAGAVLLTQTARACGLDRYLSTGMRSWRGPGAVHDPAKILLDLAITVALGGDCAADIAMLRAQPEVFGLVASDPTVSRAIDTLAETDTAVLTAIRAARAAARTWVWQRAGAPTQNGWIVLDPDATVLISHSEKEDATKTWKKTFGFHPLLVFCDHGENGTGEPMAGLLRRGNAGSNTAADHLTVLDDALAQIPAHLRQPDERGQVKVLVRTDAAGATHAFTARIAGLGMEFPSAPICTTSTSTPSSPGFRRKRGHRPTTRTGDLAMVRGWSRRAGWPI